MSEACVLVVEADILVRHPLAEYLRECGYRVLEAVHAKEARAHFKKPLCPIDVVLAEVNAPTESGFVLAGWIREHRPRVEVVLAGTIATAAEKASELCEEGPQKKKPYDHRMLLDHIRRVIAARDRAKRLDPRAASRLTAAPSKPANRRLADRSELSPRTGLAPSS